MATAKLWWNGSAWKTSKTTCVSNYSGYSSSSYAYVWYKVWIAAYDNGTIKMSTDLSAYQGSVSGTAWISDGTKTMKVGGTTLGTGTFSNVDVTNYIGTNLSWSGNVYCKIYWQDTSGSIYVWKESAGSANYASGTINMATSPFRTITYNANGGTGAPSAKTVVTGVSSSLSTTVPTRTGYTFLGWNTDSSATTATYSPGSTISTTSNIVLYAIWKAQLTQIDAPNGTIGTALTITLTQQGSAYDYNHTIKWTVNGTTQTIASNVTSASQTITQSWTPSIATIVPLYTDRSSYPCTLTCETYNGATLLGSMTKTITLAVPSSCAPTISGSVSPTNNPPSFTDYVSGKSKAQFTYTATTQYSATVVSWKYTINGTTTTVADSSTTKTYTPATAVTSSPVSVTVVDSRGMTATVASTAVTVTPYTAPTITNPVITRALQDGTMDEQGEYLLVTADIAITALNNLNTKNYAIKYKLHNDSTWTDAQASTALSGYTAAISWVSPTDILSDVDSYDVQLIATDFYSSTVVQQTVSTSATIIDILADGTGVSFGKIAEHSNTVQIAGGWNFMMDDTVMTEADLIYLLSIQSKLTDKVLYFSGIACSATTGNFVEYVNSKITSNHVLASVVFADPTAITSDFTWTTSGSNQWLRLNGTCASATTCNVILIKKDN